MNTCLNGLNPENYSEYDSKDICLECGGHCCKLGGVIVTKDEVEAIIERGFPNHFIPLSDDVYGIEWGFEGRCNYLTNGGCSIYPVRPLGCRMFPVVQTRSGEVILVECPLSFHLTKEELTKRVRILKQRPSDILKESEHLREDYFKDLHMRLSKFNYRKLI